MSLLNTRFPRHDRIVRPHRETGAALLVSLVLLVAVTLLGVSAMQGTILQERMSANQRDIEEAFNAGEIAVRRGETDLLQDPLGFLGNTQFTGLPASWSQDSSQWDLFVPIALPDDMDNNLYVRNPIYHIAPRGTVCESVDVSSECDELFTITARGTGRSINTFVVLESTYRLRR